MECFDMIICLSPEKMLIPNTVASLKYLKEVKVIFAKFLIQYMLNLLLIVHSTFIYSGQDHHYTNLAKWL